MHPVPPISLALTLATLPVLAAAGTTPRTPPVSIGLGADQPGYAAGQQFGYQVAGAGDFNHDGRADWMVSAPVDDSAGQDVGAVYVFFSGRGGVFPWAQPVIFWLRFDGEGVGDKFGEGLAGLGDWNADGIDDVIMSADGNDAGGPNAGRAYIHFGETFAALDTIADRVLTGEAPGDFFGFSCASAGDLNGDGFPDAAVSAPLNDRGGNNAGAVFLYWGGPAADTIPDAVLVGLRENGQLGRGLGGVGDVNGDGHQDFAAGAPYADYKGPNSGAAYVWLGGPGFDTQPDYFVFAESAGDAFGWPLRGAGDVDGDGYDDLAVSAPLNDDGGATARGAVYLYRGGPIVDAAPDWIVRGNAAGATFGLGLDAGDVNDDGFSDLLVGVPFNFPGAPDAGHGRIYFGGPQPDTLEDEILPFGGNRAGNSIAYVGDVRGDGFGDVVLGAYHDSTRGPETGRSVLFDVKRHHLQTAGWLGGDEFYVVWNGAEPADLELSRDGGRTFSTLARGVGGSTLNVHRPTQAGVATNQAIVRVVSTDRTVSGVVTSFRFQIGDGGSRLAAWPSPARRGAAIQLSMSELPGTAPDEVSVFDLHGRKVGVIPASGVAVIGGIAQITWDGRGHAGLLPSGLYLLRARTGSWEGRARLVILE